MITRFLAFSLGMLCVLLGVGCATVPTVPPADVIGGSDAAALPAQFALRARVGVKQDERQDSFTLTWERLRENGETLDLMRIFTPFGSQVAELRVDRAGAVLRRGTDEMAAERATTLSENLLGVAIDPDLLLRWLASSGATTIGAWQISVERLERFGEARLASRLVASRDGQTVRIVIDEFAAK